MQAEPKQNANEGVDAKEANAETKREQSGIDFPYADLDAAIEVVRAISTIGGQSCESDQLAGYWRIAPSGGNFRARYAPARTFGLLTMEKGRLILTPLGMRIVDRTQEQAARVDAFLHVSLYRAIYEKYKGYQLPGAQALEGEMVKLGVAQKQKDKARQVFVRAARQAGFHWAGEDRLVKPNLSAALTPPETLQHDVADNLAPIERESQNSRTGGPNGGGRGGGGEGPPGRPMEYQLIDLLKRPGIGDEQRKAIWTLIQFLTGGNSDGPTT